MNIYQVIAIVVVKNNMLLYNSKTVNSIMINVEAIINIESIFETTTDIKSNGKQHLCRYYFVARKYT